MNKNNKKRMRITTMLLKTLCFVSILITFSCTTDETQTVATFTNLVMADEFDIEGAPAKMVHDCALV